MASGHLVRSLALAQAWESLGGRALLVARCSSGDAPASVAASGIELVVAPASHPDDADSDFVATLIKARGASWVSCDGYHFDARYTGRLRREGARVLVLDDVATAPLYDADAILNQNIGAQRFTYACVGPAALLLGPRFALLRPEFLSRAPRADSDPRGSVRVLVTMGGSDPDNQTARVLRALDEVEAPALEVTVIVGNTNPHRQALQQQIRGLRRQDVTLIDNPPDVAAQFERAHFAISGAGSTCYELCHLGVPMILVTLAANQRGIADGLQEVDAAVHVGRADQAIDAELVAATRLLAADPARRRRMAAAGRRLVDGKGAERVARTMLEMAA